MLQVDGNSLERVASENSALTCQTATTFLNRTSWNSI
jgi:hypothetical protein